MKLHRGFNDIDYLKKDSLPQAINLQCSEAMANVLFIDSRHVVWKESGDVILSNASIFVEVGKIFLERCQVPFRRRPCLSPWALQSRTLQPAKFIFTLASEIRETFTSLCAQVTGFIRSHFSLVDVFLSRQTLIYTLCCNKRFLQST